MLEVREYKTYRSTVAIDGYYREWMVYNQPRLAVWVYT